MAKQKAKISTISSRVKAFLLDIFLIAMPMLYITAYLVLDGKEDFQNNQFAIMIIWLIYGIITSIFHTKSAQTPGYRAYELYIIDLKTGKKINFIKAFIRYLLFLISATSVIGICLCFFRKDRLNLHDLLTDSAPVSKKIS
ncbi:RDD family membrane protein [Campylobacter blaseri]|uniref:RDD domain-containing protein n=1 Tax=Campylobacter blaseri TaxID=2042961 RepID=A0A2P8R3L0_9BACT|nr:RDD family protein [Campylobacter blaseri]PSM53087.1 hypothetical protein CQ405_00610 [Campylobacter blaseri]PSM54554.1 hypothetical protein CRN67_00610 [Campylobacter blaseri]QKF86975.1 RDD family membrane protein [Campylobacter blaseri]